MNRRKLGRQGLEVSAIGLGCMGMSEFYGTADEGEAVATIDRALDLGRRTTFGGSRSRFRRGSPRGIATAT